MWIALGHTDTRNGMQGLALLVQQGFERNPHGGDLFVFRSRAASITKLNTRNNRDFGSTLTGFVFDGAIAGIWAPRKTLACGAVI